jgi:hypothetical protein
MQGGLQTTLTICWRLARSLANEARNEPRNVIFRQLRLGNPMIGEYALIRGLSTDLPPAPRPQLIEFQNRIVQIV